MTETVVVHCRRAPYDVYIGRPSKWGNPFRLGAYGRDQAVDNFARWIVNQPALMAALPELKGKRLGCYCAPKRCHGDVLARLANQREESPQ